MNVLFHDDNWHALMGTEGKARRGELDAGEVRGRSPFYVQRAAECVNPEFDVGGVLDTFVQDLRQHRVTYDVSLDAACFTDDFSGQDLWALFGKLRGAYDTVREKFSRSGANNPFINFCRGDLASLYFHHWVQLRGELFQTFVEVEVAHPLRLHAGGDTDDDERSDDAHDGVFPLPDLPEFLGEGNSGFDASSDAGTSTGDGGMRRTDAAEEVSSHRESASGQARSRRRKDPAHARSGAGGSSRTRTNSSTSSGDSGGNGRRFSKSSSRGSGRRSGGGVTEHEGLIAGGLQAIASAFSSTRGQHAAEMAEAPDKRKLYDDTEQRYRAMRASIAELKAKPSLDTDDEDELTTRQAILPTLRDDWVTAAAKLKG
ncbi:unnamed protein product [Phaeothamnion confervicola]